MRAFVLVASLLMACPALAGPPQEIVAKNQILLSVGQSKTFRFDEPVGRIDFATKDTAEAVPHNDQQITIVGTKPGVTQLFISTPSGASMYSAEIIVQPEPGHLVKIYGTGKNDDLNAGYMAVFCTSNGCSRPDQDLPRPTAITIERVSRFKEGALNSR